MHLIFPLLHTFLIISPVNSSVKKRGRFPRLQAPLSGFFISFLYHKEDITSKIPVFFAVQRVGVINCGPMHTNAVNCSLSGAFCFPGNSFILTLRQYSTGPDCLFFACKILRDSLPRSASGALIHHVRGIKHERDIDMSLSYCSIGADAPAAAFGKTAAPEDAG